MNKENVYVGPKPFTNEQKNIFFGRTVESSNLVSLILSHKIVLLYSESGAGKTSLLNASVIPSLKKEGFDHFPVIRLNVLEYSIDNLDSIDNIFVYNTINGLHEGSKIDHINNKESISKSLGKSEVPRLLVFDQFEELFTSFRDRWENRKDFISELLLAIDQDPMLRIVLSLREDYLASLDSLVSNFPERYFVRFRLEKLKENAALEAIKKPALLFDKQFNEDALQFLLDKLMMIKSNVIGEKVKEVKGEFVESVQLQLLCQNIWQNIPEELKIIKKSHIEEFGDFNNILIDFYEKTILKIAVNKNINIQILRAFFQEKLITSIHTRGTIYRDIDQTGGIPNEIIDLLEDHYLIKSERRAGAKWYELTHDSFIPPIIDSNKIFTNNLIQLDHNFFNIENQLKLDKKDINFGKIIDNLELLYSKYEKICDPFGQIKILFKLADISREESNDESDLLSYYSRIIEIDNKHLIAHFLRGEVYWYQNRLEEALTDYLRTLEFIKEDDHIEIYKGIFHNKGQILAEMGRFQEAVYDLQYAVELRERYDLGVDYARNGLAFALGGIGKYEKSLKEFELAIIEHPENAWVYHNRGIIYEKMNRNDDAIKDYDKALQFNKPPLNKPRKEDVEKRLNLLRKL